jgi:hypothetical protein
MLVNIWINDENPTIMQSKQLNVTPTTGGQVANLYVFW